MSRARAAFLADETAWYRPVLSAHGHQEPGRQAICAEEQAEAQAGAAATCASGADHHPIGPRVGGVGEAHPRQPGAYRDRVYATDPTSQRGRDADTWAAGHLAGLAVGEAIFQYYDQLSKNELFEFKQIRAITETTLQTRNRDTLSILEANPGLLDAVPRLSDLRTHLVVWLNKYDGLFVSTPEMCVLYVGVEDGVPFPRGIERSIQEWLDLSQAPPATGPKPSASRPEAGRSDPAADHRSD